MGRKHWERTIKRKYGSRIHYHQDPGLASLYAEYTQDYVFKLLCQEGLPMVLPSDDHTTIILNPAVLQKLLRMAKDYHSHLGDGGNFTCLQDVTLAQVYAFCAPRDHRVLWSLCKGLPHRFRSMDPRIYFGLVWSDKLENYIFTS